MYSRRRFTSGRDSASIKDAGDDDDGGQNVVSGDSKITRHVLETMGPLGIMKGVSGAWLGSNGEESTIFSCCCNGEPGIRDCPDAVAALVGLLLDGTVPVKVVVSEFRDSGRHSHKKTNSSTARTKNQAASFDSNENTSFRRFEFDLIPSDDVGSV